MIRVFFARLKVHLLAVRNRSVSCACMVRFPLFRLRRQEADLLLPIWRLCTVLIQIVIVGALAYRSTCRGPEMLERISGSRTLLYGLP